MILVGRHGFSLFVFLFVCLCFCLFVCLFICLFVCCFFKCFEASCCENPLKFAFAFGVLIRYHSFRAQIIFAAAQTKQSWQSLACSVPYIPAMVLKAVVCFGMQVRPLFIDLFQMSKDIER